MRELKFRAWDIENKKWLKDWSSYKAGGSEQYFVGFNGDLGCHRTIVGLPMPILNIDDEPDGIIIEQYTGLKDKNGKEIYEGDILEFDKDFDDSAQRYVPYFDEKLAAFGFRIYGYQDYISESGSEEFESEMSLISEMENYEREEIIFYTEYISIVGNIHENPELIGKEQ